MSVALPRLASQRLTHLLSKSISSLASHLTRSQDLWSSDIPSRGRHLRNARLFPVLHASEPLGLEDVLWLLGSPESRQLQRWQASWRMSWEELWACLDQEEELAYRQALFFQQAQSKIRRVLVEHSNCSLLPLIRSAVIEGYQEAVLNTLDEGTKWVASLVPVPTCCSATAPSSLVYEGEREQR